VSLRDAQTAFARLIPRLIDKAFELGFEVTLGDAYRDPRVFGPIGQKRGYGHSRSAHKQRLAIDLNLFKDGQFLATTEAHTPLGEWWEQQHELARWGGRFDDGNHYSFEIDGIK
jgi:hypothetical protein